MLRKTARIICCAALISTLFPVLLRAQSERRPITVADMVRLRTVITSFDDPLLLSPDGQRYVMVLLRGDLVRNGSWVEFWAGKTTSFERAVPKKVAQLFTSSTARGHELVRQLTWFNQQEIAFLWDGGDRPVRLLALNVSTGHVSILAAASTSIAEYSGDQKHGVLVYTACHRSSAPNHLRDNLSGFAVRDQSIWSFLGDSSAQQKMGDPDRYDTFVVNSSRGKPQKVAEPEIVWGTSPEFLALAPNATRAIAVRPAAEIPDEWHAYTNSLFRDVYLPSVHPGSRQANFIRQYEIIDVASRRAWPLWNAPMNPMGGVVWSPDGEYVAVGPTFLPPLRADAAGLAGRAVAVVRVRDGSFVVLPGISENSEWGYRPVTWTPDNVITLEKAGDPARTPKRLSFTRTLQGWREIPGGEEASHPQTPIIRIEVRQSPNHPPVLYGVDSATGQSKPLLEINPALHHLNIGRVEVFHWKSADGRPWTGMLYYPTDYRPGIRYPLVIQTHGYDPEKFSLEGGLSTAFAAQPLAAAGMAVLQLGGPDAGESEFLATPMEARVAAEGYESAITALADAGVVDPRRVGIIGFSRTGWHVEYALTHSQFRFAAAIVADNMDGGYLQYVLGDNSQRSEFERDAGARPFGDGLNAWVRNAPGFLADRINTPLRLEFDSGPLSAVVEFWELFSHLRYLGRPVELFIIPNIAHGAHILQNPVQRMASQGGTVDWFRFWLKGEESADPGKARQYSRWRELRSQSLAGSRVPLSPAEPEQWNGAPGRMGKTQLAGVK